MAFTNKIKGVIGTLQNNLQGGVGGAIGGTLSNLASAVTSQAQNTKIAAKLLNKSPLELNDVDALSHMKENPYAYGNVAYPSSIGNMGEGHYMVFDILMDEDSAFKTKEFEGINIKDFDPNARDENLSKATGSNVKRGTVKKIQQETDRRVIRRPNGGLAKAMDRHTHISDTIMLYTPPSAMKFDYKANYAGDQGLGTIGAIAMGLSRDGGLEKLKGLGGAGLEGLRNMATGIADAVTGDAVSGIQTLGLGTSKNPMMAQIFKDVPFREFTFNYEFIPRNEKEKDDVYKIINLFKFHMLPEMTTEFRFLVPSQFQVQYMYRSKENSYIPKISRCILTGASFDYAPEQIQSFKADAQGAPMAHIKMDLTFAETEIMTKETIAEGF